MNPGEVWRLEDGSRRLVLSQGTYNASALGRVVTAVVAGPPSGFDPFAVDTEHGTVYADRVAMHPRHWLIEPVARLDPAAYRGVRVHLMFLLNLP